MSQTSNTSYTSLKWFVAIVLLSIIIYQVYSGFVLKKVGVPGIFEVEFADSGKVENSSTCTELDKNASPILLKLLEEKRNAIAYGRYIDADLLDLEYWETLRVELKQKGFGHDYVSSLSNRELTLLARQECLIR